MVHTLIVGALDGMSYLQSHSKRSVNIYSPLLLSPTYKIMFLVFLTQNRDLKGDASRSWCFLVMISWWRNCCWVMYSRPETSTASAKAGQIAKEALCLCHPKHGKAKNLSLGHLRQWWQASAWLLLLGTADSSKELCAAGDTLLILH